VDSNSVVPAECAVNLVVLSPAGRCLQLKYALDDEDKEYLRDLNQETDTFVINGYVGLLSQGICKKASAALIERGAQIGVPSLTALGMILFAHYCNDQCDKASTEQFTKDFNAAVDLCVKEVRAINLKAIFDALNIS
jgi:Flp pilus assembly protein TadB